ncbi:MAG: sigma-70 family RNA polymerase sigma factor [Gemmatimonadota bacterium]|nr:sigma-70 family RNA polymerase sigma factor [Gemmatimonadota bacterium]
MSGDAWRRLASGDEAALAALYDRLAPRVYGLAVSMLGRTGDAEEVVTDTFVQVWQTAGTFDPERGEVDAWVISIARSRALDRRRRLTRRGELAVRQEHRIARFTTSEPAPDPGDAALVRTEMSETVEPALRELPPEQRTAIELAYLGGLTQSEIAGELGVPLGTVKTRIRTGMRTLRDALLHGGDRPANREGES